MDSSCSLIDSSNNNCLCSAWFRKGKNPHTVTFILPGGGGGGRGQMPVKAKYICAFPFIGRIADF